MTMLEKGTCLQWRPLVYSDLPTTVKIFALNIMQNSDFGPTQFDDFRNYFLVTKLPKNISKLCVKGECDSLTGSHLINSLITAACSNLNEESRVSRMPTLA